MLTLQKCRSLLGADCKLTDAQITQLRQELYAFSDVAVEAFRASRKLGVCPGIGSCLDAIPGQEREAILERAAILEYEGHLRKPEAERQAFGEWAQSKKPPGRKPRKKASKRNSSKSSGLTS